MHWLAQAPANIALIKYMGKSEENSNLPDNSSLSFTLNNLQSTVQLEIVPGHKDIWEPLPIPGGAEFTLSANGQKRFLDHIDRIKLYFDYEGNFLVRSSNNFPHGSGLASSASSFAALTKCTCLALEELTGRVLSIDEQAQLSRLGSGSSCRSFYSPWALWKNDKVYAIDLPYKNLLHQVVIISAQEKEVSSSLAHKRVKTSAQYATRNQRAEENLTQLLEAFKAEDWRRIYEICWREFHDMHHLFSSCREPFTYINNDSTNLLKILENFWETTGDGPIVTMDAGPNIHLLYRPDQAELAHQFKLNYLVGNYDVL